ncbi:hypothetical protein [Mesorhizobium sp.]|uniref:hypothetical protein n=1 Tax=Mesorhizobium sp. TaxID=1871066 RepID=UPI000FE80357|nr:hypothetical protein [Mesorhizobium sp.]RWA83657.1 MAG: hypothetical protein EOQ32_27865 [Mesorhizobium sp.]
MPWYGGPTPRLSPEQKVEPAQFVETGPDLAVDGVLHWRRIDLQRVSEDCFGVACQERDVGKLLKKTRLLAHERGAAPSGAGCLDRGRAEKTFRAR